MAGFDALTNFSHYFENLLSSVRDQQLSVTPELIDVLLKANDTLKEWINLLAKDNQATYDASETLGLIQGFLPASEEAHEVAVKSPKPEVIVKTAESVPNEVLSAMQVTILVCEDDQALLDVLRKVLSQLNFNILTAKNGQEGMDILRDNKVDVIVADLKMPVLDGLDLVDQVHKINDTIPFILISGYASREDIIAFIHRGVFDFLEKPFDAAAIAQAVSRAQIIKKHRDLLQYLGVLNFRSYMSCFSLLDLLRHSNQANENLKLFEKVDAELAEVKKIITGILETKLL